MRRCYDQHDHDARRHPVGHVDRPTIPEQAGADEHDGDIEGERGPLHAEQVSAEAVGHELVEQDGEFLRVARFLA